MWVEWGEGRWVDVGRMRRVGGWMWVEWGESSWVDGR